MGRGLLSHRYKSTQRGRLTSICTQIQAEHTQQMSAWRKHLHERSASRDFDARLSCAIRLSCSPSIPTSSMPDKNVSLCTRGPILCLKSHLHLFFFFFFCSPRCPSLPPSYLSAPLLPASCSCNEGHRRLHCPPLPRPHAPAPGQITPATCTGRSPGTLPRRGFHPSLTSPFRASHPLILAPCH